MCAVEVCDRGHLVYVGHNDLLTSMFGDSFDDIIDKPFDCFFSAASVDRISSNYWHCIDTRKPVHSKIDVELPTGPVTIASTVVPVLDADGELIRVVGNAVGRKQGRKAVYAAFLDELTALSAEGSSNLFDALRAVELRRESGALSPDEERFLEVFSQLSERALRNSLIIRDKVRAQGSHAAASEFLAEGELSQAIRELSAAI